MGRNPPSVLGHVAKHRASHSVGVHCGILACTMRAPLRSTSHLPILSVHHRHSGRAVSFLCGAGGSRLPGLCQRTPHSGRSFLAHEGCPPPTPQRCIPLSLAEPPRASGFWEWQAELVGPKPSQLTPPPHQAGLLPEPSPQRSLERWAGRLFSGAASSLDAFSSYQLRRSCPALPFWDNRYTRGRGAPFLS